MSIEEHRREVIEFRLGGGKSVMDVITAAPGEVRTGLHCFRTLTALEEYIEALRRAAKVANLPDRSDEAKSA